LLKNGTEDISQVKELRSTGFRRTEFVEKNGTEDISQGKEPLNLLEASTLDAFLRSMGFGKTEFFEKWD
jgi:hypothetical protein